MAIKQLILLLPRVRVALDPLIEKSKTQDPKLSVSQFSNNNTLSEKAWKKKKKQRRQKDQK